MSSFVRLLVSLLFIFLNHLSVVELWQFTARKEVSLSKLILKLINEDLISVTLSLVSEQG